MRRLLDDASTGLFLGLWWMFVACCVLAVAGYAAMIVLSMVRVAVNLPAAVRHWRR